MTHELMLCDVRYVLCETVVDATC